MPIITAMGAAVDYSRANSVKASLQAALDSAVLAGAKDGTSNWLATASNTFNGNLVTKASIVSAPSFAFDGNTTYTGQATATVPTMFVGLLGFSSLNVSVNSVAAAGSPDNSCILTLDQGQARSDVSVTLNGAPNVNLSGCAMRSNTSMTCNVTAAVRPRPLPRARLADAATRRTTPPWCRISTPRWPRTSRPSAAARAPALPGPRALRPPRA